MSPIRLLTAGCIAFSLCFATAAGGAAKPRRWFAPLLTLPAQPVIRCILHAESRSTLAHPNTGDRDPYQFGPFQFTPILWNRWSWVAGVGRRLPAWYLGTQALNAVSVPAYRATLYQQALVFATVDRVDGLGPWTQYDGC